MRDIRWAMAIAMTGIVGCRDVSSFTTSGDSFQGSVVQASFVRAGVDPSTCMCLTLDANHLQDAPGAISTTDGRFQSAPLRSIPELWNDPLSTLNFGEGRLRNLTYVVSATTPFDDGAGQEVFAVVSLMQSGDVEVRLLRGAPPIDVDSGSPSTHVFAVFPLTRHAGVCPCSS